MAKFRVEMVDGRAYEVEAPEGTPQETLFAAIQERYPLAFKSTEELESAKSAPFRAADIAKSAKMGLAGGVQSLTDIFGAGNVASQYLQEAQQEAFKGLSPERIAEIERREELKKRAEGKGLGREIGASVGAFTEAPAQTLAQALFSSAPIIASAAIPGGQAAGAARLLAAARGPTAVGAAMGLGGQKGQDYETVKRELLSQGIPEEEAEQRAQKAAEYSAQNILRQAGAAAAGAVEGRFGVEPAVGRLLSRRTIEGGKTPPTWSQAIGQSVLGEAAPEALQAAVGTIGTNQALDQAGIPTELSRGLAGTVAHDALVGAVLGLGLSPAQKANLSRDYEADRAAERKKFEDEERAKIEEIARKQQEEYERKGYQEVRKAFAPQDLTKNPLGTFKAQDLSPAVVEYLDNFRAQSGLPKLKEYSIEDIADAMPGREPAKEKEALAQFVGERAGYTPDSQVTVQTVLDEALRKNIDIDARSFTDFLGRATGVNDIREMMPQQLFAAYKSLSALPESPTIREIEGGTNATRFDQAQYESALNGIDALLAELGRPASLPAVNEEIKRTTGLKSGKAIQSLLDEAIRRGDLDEVQTPRYRTIVPETGEIVGAIYDTREEAEKAAPKGAEVQEVTQRAISSPSATARLPEGYDIREGLLQTGEAPQAYDVMAGDQILNRVKSEEEAQTKLESYAKTRAAETENARKVIDKQNARLTKSQENLNLMQVEGRGRTNVYQQAIAKHQKLTDEVNQIIAKQNERIRKFDPDTTPLSIAPVGAKAVGKTGFTVLKDGAPVATFPTREKAESSILEGLPTSRLEELTREKVRRGIGPKAQKELERRAGKEKPEQVTKLEADLRKVLNKFGLKDVSLEVAEAIDGGKAGGSYLNSLIKVALDEANPVRTLRHESLHALRDLGFFTDQQWKALTNQAKSKWIDTYLKQKNIDGQPLRAGETSRYEAYVSAYMGDMDSIIEEAVADAFADFDANKAPPGMIAAILKKLNDFFTALRNALNGAGYQTAEDVFGKIERAELTPSAKAQGRMQERLARRGERYATTEPKQPSVRPSLRGGEGKQEEGAGGRDRGRRFTGRGLAPLAGAPIIQGATGPDPRLVAVAQQYAEKIGIPFRRQAEYVEVDESRARRIAQAYEDMPHAPQDPEVKEAYADLIQQTKDQYDALVDAGYEFTFFDSNTDPYDGNPFNAMRDLRNNKRMAVYGTYDGYGTDGITGAAVEDNPMLADTGLRWPDQNGVEHMVTANDLFRAVHDAFGHGLEGAGFRARGEENAWQAHAKLFTGPAVGAITSETRGQNSWLNYGPYGEKNRTAKLQDTVFAEQKTGLMPEWTWTEGMVAEEPTGIVLGQKQTGASSFNGTHYGTSRVDSLSGAKYGTGIRGAERRRLEATDDERIKRRVYFYIPKPDGTMPIPEAGLGQYVYTQSFDNILGPGAEMSRLFSEARGDANTFESLVVDAGYDGYAAPNMGMMVVLNNDVPVDYKGTAAQQREKLSLRSDIFAKRLNSIGVKSTDDFWKLWQNIMIGTAGPRPGLSGVLDERPRQEQIKDAVAVWKKDVEQYGMRRYLYGYLNTADDEIVKAKVAREILELAQIKPTVQNAIWAYNSLPGHVISANDAAVIRSLPDDFDQKAIFKDKEFPRKPKTGTDWLTGKELIEPEAENEPKFSLRIMRGEITPKFDGKVTVDKIGKYFDDQIFAEFGRKLDYNNPQDFDRAIRVANEEVAYQ